MRNPLSVLKFSAEAIAEPTGLAEAVCEIYQRVRLGRSTIAVVQACTEAAIEAALLGHALDEAGVPSALLGLSRRQAATGTLLSRVNLGRLDLASLQHFFESVPVAILPETAPRHRPLRVALLGLGTVGMGVYDRLAAMPDCFEIAVVAVRNLHKERSCCVPRSLLVEDPWRALDLPVDVVVELIGGIEPAAALMLAALNRGVHVVTANKEVLAAKADLLHRAARARNVELKYSASVGGAVPILERLQALAPGSVRRVEGIVNGTCNFILDRLAEGQGFDEALDQARAEGFAEADAAKDLSGADSFHKLSVIARCAFGAEIGADQTQVSGIVGLDPAWVRACRERRRTVRLVAYCSSGAGPLRAAVRPVELLEGDFLAGARGVENRVVIYLRNGQTIRLAGKGAGRVPTSLAVLADLLDLSRALANDSDYPTIDCHTIEVNDEPGQRVYTF